MVNGITIIPPTVSFQLSPIFAGNPSSKKRNTGDYTHERRNKYRYPEQGSERSSSCQSRTLHNHYLVFLNSWYTLHDLGVCLGDEL